MKPLRVAKRTGRAGSIPTRLIPECRAGERVSCRGRRFVLTRTQRRYSRRNQDRAAHLPGQDRGLGARITLAFAGGLMMRPGQLKRDCQLLCKNHSQATQYPALDRCVSILVLEKLDKDPKHCSFTRVTNQNSARAISSYMVKLSLKERQSLKLPQHSQSQTNVGVWVLIARQVVLLSNPQRVLP